MKNYKLRVTNDDRTAVLLALFKFTNLEWKGGGRNTRELLTTPGYLYVYDSIMTGSSTDIFISEVAAEISPEALMFLLKVQKASECS